MCAWKPPFRSSSAINCTPLRCCPNARSSNAPSDGWKSVEGYGRTANGNSIPACSSFALPCSSSSEDREQTLRFSARAAFCSIASRPSRSESFSSIQLPGHVLIAGPVLIAARSDLDIGCVGLRSLPLKSFAGWFSYAFAVTSIFYASGSSLPTHLACQHGD